MSAEITDAEKDRVRAAIRFVHQRGCFRAATTPAPCPMCPRAMGVLNALRLLDQRPRDAKGARRALHDIVCLSSCGPDDSDHADRTQSTTAALLRKFLAGAA